MCAAKSVAPVTAATVVIVLTAAVVVVTAAAMSEREIPAMCVGVTGEATAAEGVTWATAERIPGTHQPTSAVRPGVATATGALRCTETKAATSPSRASSRMAAVATALLRRDSTTVGLLAERIMMAPAVGLR